MSNECKKDHILGDDDGNVVDDQLSNQFLTHYQ